MSGPEVTTICEGFDNNAAVFSSGIKIGGLKYFTIRADDKVIQGRKVDLPPLFFFWEILLTYGHREKKELFVIERNRLFL